ncbi:growth arrest-specific protein 1-like [Trichogramma pretiosum]|uniref:growth arrest-specific protein 1-like n=1 Tax=Trichogramma pretiosum TaxID=7493 RepID=UPI000C71A995|nr:growth arrest-specific protein 1-like [Trichogramma pretiosum]
MRSSIPLLLYFLLLVQSFDTVFVSASRLFPIATSLGIRLNNGENDTTATTTTTSGGSSGGGEEEVDAQAVNATMRCDDANLRCAYRAGCGRALQHYLTRCASVLQGDVNECPEFCQHALIGLMSTDEGKELMTCQCAKDDALCRRSKQRAEICRASVTSTLNRERVSCRVAQWICNGDVQCSTALQYYNGYCKRMFHGKKCTKHCRNSINILRRQEKAAKLSTCFCDGTEDYDCNAIQRNMEVLCFNKPSSPRHNYDDMPNRTSSSSGAGDRTSGPNGHGKGGSQSSGSGDVRTNKVPSRASTTTSASQSWRILLLGLVLLLHSALTHCAFGALTLD